jgi:hypothetical protein
MDMTPSWELLASGRTPVVGPLLRLDTRAVAVGDIRGFVATTDLQGKRAPAIATMAVFAIVGLLFLAGVIDIGMRGRILVAAILFGSVALAALNDMMQLAMSGVFRVDVLTAGGETFRHSTTDAAEHAALLAALGTIVGQNSVMVPAEEMALPTPAHFNPAAQAASVAA